MLNPTGLRVTLPGAGTKPGKGGTTRGNSSKSILDYAADVRARDYYGERGEAESLKTGGGWADLGFSEDEQPTKEQLENLLNGYGPNGDELARIRPGKLLPKEIAAGKSPEIRAGIDLTFSAPKSFSLVSAFASAEHQAELRAAQVAAIRDAVAWIEDEGYVALRSGLNGTDREPARRLIVQSWFHETSRAEDPQQHVHAILFNLSRTAEGEWRRIDPADVYRHKIEIGAVYRSALAMRLVALGYSIERDRTSFRIKGVPETVVQHFSKGTDAIRERLVEWGVSGGKAAQAAAYQVRGDKKHTPKAELEVRWRSEFSALGFTIEDAAAIRTDAQQAHGVAYDEAAVIRDLSSNNATFTDSDLRKSVAIAMQAGGGGPEDVRQALDRLRRSERLVELVDPDGITRWTTADMRRDEFEMVRLFAKRQERGRAVSDATLAWAIAEAEKITGFTFSAEQRKAVGVIMQAKSADKFLQGVSGAGKSTIALAIRLGYEREERKVYGLALAAKAAAGLSDGTGIETSTIDSFLLRIEHQAPPQGSVVLVDEASMSHTRQMLAMVRAAEKHGLELGIIGDTVQLQSIQAGSAFAFLYSHALKEDTAEIKTASRQIGEYADEWKAKLAEVRKGKALPALAYLNELGGLKIAEEGEYIADSVKAWLANRAAGLSADQNVLVTNRRDIRKQLNEAVRGAIGIAVRPDNVTVATTDREGQSTGKRSFAPGDRVMTLRNSKLGPKLAIAGTDDSGRLSNGSVWTVEDIRKAGDDNAVITMKSDAGRRVCFTTSEYDALDHAYSYTTHQAQGISANGVVCLISDANMVDRHSVYVMLSRSRFAERTHVVIPSAVLDEAETVAGVEAPSQERPLAERLDTIARAAERLRIDNLSISYRAKDTAIAAREAREMDALMGRIERAAQVEEQINAQVRKAEAASYRQAAAEEQVLLAQTTGSTEELCQAQPPAIQRLRRGQSR